MYACIRRADGRAIQAGTREIAAEEFFEGTYLTALTETEMLVAVLFPAISNNEHHLFHEFARRSGDYAMLGAAFVLGMDATTITKARLAFFSVSDRPLLAVKAATGLIGQSLTGETIEACARSARVELDCLGDLYNSAQMKRQLVKTLTRRMLAQLGKEPV